MNILLIMDPFIAVPPLHYGGIERVVADLANELTARGHALELWAAPGSRTAAPVRPFGREGEWSRWSGVRNTSLLTARLVRDASRFDVIHNFGRLAYLTSVFRRDVVKVQTYMRRVNPANMRLASRLGARQLHFTAVSAAIKDTGAPGGGAWSVVYNCAPAERYVPNYDVDPQAAPLAFLGRLERCKGAHTAIAVARQLGRTLHIAGNVSDLPEEREYFEREIRPEIDGEQIVFLGPVDDARKNQLLANAAAMLLPIEWEEPFPVVLPESLLCGTPVIAFRRGGVPEGIAHGRTGFLCDTAEQMAEAVNRLGELSRRECRRVGEERFSPAAIADEYERLYRQLLGSEQCRAS
ncbi:MAG: glycosyltransferase family 4 protein [Gemmatimonadetes bacterium]|nr:glycosyltransferase family 4 protein [Gemmatimonadota bacterium]